VGVRHHVPDFSAKPEVLYRCLRCLRDSLPVAAWVDDECQGSPVDVPAVCEEWEAA
jgi:hypothetical protein